MASNLTAEDLEILQGDVNSITFVRSGLQESSSYERDLLDQAIAPLRRLLLPSEMPPQTREVVASSDVPPSKVGLPDEGNAI